MERAMRFELTTSTLARWRSTTELRPLGNCVGAFYMPAPDRQEKSGKFFSESMPFFRIPLHPMRKACFLLPSPIMSTVPDKLAEIIATKYQEVEALMPRAAHIRAAALQRNEFRGFRNALMRGNDRLGVIAEVKKASPSVGLIDPNFDPIRQAKRYLDGGASCLSILTDEKYFQGSLSFLAKISEFSNAPLLRKDFTVHPVQIHEAVVAGADAILLIVAALDDDNLKRLYQEARDFQLDVLVEVHDLPEMERAIDLGADLIGINNRNLKTFVIDLATTEKLADEVPDEVVLVSESGLKTPEDAQRALDAGANAVLIGESLMRAHNPAEEIEAYLDLRAD
jgi:indole-3-glycerol phosphate synthase